MLYILYISSATDLIHIAYIQIWWKHVMPGRTVMMLNFIGSCVTQNWCDTTEYEHIQIAYEIWEQRGVFSVNNNISE